MDTVNNNSLVKTMATNFVLSKSCGIQLKCFDKSFVIEPTK